jgi:uncharacterized delta-60 repeat protein
MPYPPSAQLNYSIRINQFIDSLEPRSYFTAGALDPTFGTAGVVKYPITAVATLVATDAVEEADGKIVVGTSAGILRFNRSGSIDTSFGSHSFVAAPAGTEFAQVALQPGGKVVVVEKLPGGSSIALKRLDLKRNGVLDNGFNGGVITGAGFTFAGGLAVQRDGKILVAGDIGPLGGQTAAVVRLNADGTLDKSFGNLGEVLGPTATKGDANAIDGVAVRSDGTILLVGEIGFGMYTAYSAAFSSTGAPISLIPQPTQSNSFYNNVVARPDGLFVMGFESGRSPFGSMGMITPATPAVSFQGSFSSSDVYVDAITATASDQIVVGQPTSTGWTLERYLPNQQPDASFGTGGLASVTLDQSGGAVVLHSLLSTVDGHIMAVGSYVGPGGSGGTGVVLVRFQAASTPVRDTTPPAASLVDASTSSSPFNFEYFTIEYTDDVAIKASTIRKSNIVVKGPRSFGTHKTILIGTSGGNGSPLFATYAVAGPHRGLWTAADNGSYSIILQRKQVTDTSGNSVPASTLGAFTINITAAARAV